MRIIRLYIIFCLLGCVSLTTTAQNEHNKQIRKFLRNGNRQFREGNRDRATTSYQKALTLDSINAKALYNMATSLLPEEFWRPWSQRNDTLMNKEVNRIDSLFQQAADHENNPLKKSKSFYNKGVMYQSLYQSNGKNEQYLKMAIEAYKNALRNNPTDNEARYNLVVCQKQMKKKNQTPPPPQDQQQQNQQQQQNDSTQNQQQQQDKQQQKQNQNQQQNQQQKMDQQRMDQMLQKAMQKERETQKRMNEEMQEGQYNRRPNRKNW